VLEGKALWENQTNHDEAKNFINDPKTVVPFFVNQIGRTPSTLRTVWPSVSRTPGNDEIVNKL